MGYSNSSLVDCVVKSPNHSGTRTHKIDRITPHCVVGQLSAEAIGKCFPAGRNASCNYGIGYDGRVSLIVDEANRSWCSSSSANDQRAITIEVASDSTEPYAFKDAAYKKLVKLCIDICKRNGLKKVYWFGDKNKSLNYQPKDGECVFTVHRWFANKSCPGNWMYSRMGQLANEVNAGLGASTSDPQPESTPSTNLVKDFPSTPFTVQVLISDLNYRSSSSMSGKVLGQTGKGTFTITEVKNGWGKLKSGAGWIYLENPTYCKVKGAATVAPTRPQPTVTAPYKVSLTGANDEEKIWNYLKAKVGNDYGVAGIMGNMFAESGLRPNNLQNSYETKLGMTDAQYTAAVDNGSYTNFVRDSAGYGLVQWTYWSLKQDFLNYVKSKGTSIGDLGIQLEFLCKQLSEQYTSVWNTCKNAKTVLEASNAVLLKFERPADQSAAVQSKRASYGQTYFNKYAKGVSTTPQTPAVKPQKPATTSSKKATNAAQKYDKSLAGTYKTTAALNIRNGAGTNHAVLVTIPKGTKVSNYGYYSLDSSNTKWLYIQFTYKNVTYTAFACSRYLSK